MSETTETLPAKRRRGRPRKWTVANVQRILRCIERGTPFVHACAAVGISKASFCARRNRYPEFERAIQSAVAKGIAARLLKIERASATDWRAAAWLLEHCAPEFFAKSRVQLEAVGQIEHSFVIPAETLNAIAESRRRYEQIQIEAKRA
jgi:hypothetical protein